MKRSKGWEFDRLYQAHPRRVDWWRVLGAVVVLVAGALFAGLLGWLVVVLFIIYGS